MSAHQKYEIQKACEETLNNLKSKGIKFDDGRVVKVKDGRVVSDIKPNKSKKKFEDFATRADGTQIAYMYEVHESSPSSSDYPLAKFYNKHDADCYALELTYKHYSDRDQNDDTVFIVSRREYIFDNGDFVYTYNLEELNEFGAYSL